MRFALAWLIAAVAAIFAPAAQADECGQVLVPVVPFERRGIARQGWMVSVPLQRRTGLKFLSWRFLSRGPGAA